MSENILIIAGEVSGDIHGAELLRELKSLRPDAEFYGIGGDEMIKNGLRANVHIRQMAFLGLVEVFKHLPFIQKVKKNLMTLVNEKRIRTAILIDYPGFNLSLANQLKNSGLHIIYYISPQVWAWGKHRIKRIKQLVDKMLVVLPFEERMYRERGVDAEFIGHPLTEQIKRYRFLSREELNKKFDLSPDKNILLVLTGSRKQEVKLIYPAVIEGAKKIARQWNMQIVIGCAPTIDPKHFQSAGENVIIAQDNILDFMKHSSFGIIKSGTSTLQAGLLGLPMIIVYKANALTYHIGKNVVKIDHLGLANIIAEKTIVPELLQNDLTKENLLLIANAIIGDNARLENMKKDLSVLQARLGEKEASKNGAAIIHRYLNEHQEN